MHNHRNAALPVLGLLLPACLGVCAGATSRAGARVPPPRLPARVAAARAYGRLPVALEPNVGQTDPRARFIARGRGVTAFLTDRGAVLRAGGKKPAVVTMTFVGANPRPEATGEAPMPGRVNYLVGPRSQWKSGIPTFARARFHAVYPGVDVAYHRDDAAPGRLEYDFEVAPGADPGRIAVAFTGADAPEIAADGALRL